MAALTDAQIAAYAYQAGFRGENLIRAVAIALGESGGRPGAHNPNRATGDNSYGLWQINMIDTLGPARRAQFGISANEDLFDPATNARAAFIVSGGGANFGPWTVYTRGTWQQFADRARAAAANPAQLAAGAVSGIFGGLELPNPFDAGRDAVADALGGLVDPFLEGLRRLAVIATIVVAGVALVVAGAWRGVRA